MGSSWLKMGERPSENNGVAMKSALSFSDGLSDNSRNNTQKAIIPA